VISVRPAEIPAPSVACHRVERLEARALGQWPRDAIRAQKLLRAAKRGDRGARERLVALHLGLVKAIASRYRDLGLPLDDLIQEGSLGLLEAIDHHDSSLSAFETYARFRVRRAIRNALTEQARLVRLPKQIVERRRAVAQADDRLTEAMNGHRPTLGELAAETGLPTSAVADAGRAAVTTVSLDEPLLPDGTTRESMVADATAPDPLHQTLEHEQARLVRRAVGQLGKRKREVVSHHFGFGQPERPLSDVAAELHLSPRRTQALERDALDELRGSLERAGVEP
jgi:RNA polymerase sigma factor (sigma-70 family)